mmetsp:Transcript_108151/g.312534  ORF Transcript_108151/g.312534 Transcript_108151/m.312534 type:complete len:276 (+) Transcript_108151:122-949(+)
MAWSSLKTFTLAAFSFPGLWSGTMSNITLSPSRNTLPWTSFKCTKTSPDVEAMNPYPLPSLKRFTRPVTPVAAAVALLALRHLLRTASKASLSHGKGARAGPMPLSSAKDRRGKDCSRCRSGRAKTKRSPPSHTRHLPPSSRAKARAAASWQPKSTTARPDGLMSMPSTIQMLDAGKSSPVWSSNHSCTSVPKVWNNKPSRQTMLCLAATKAAGSVSKSTHWKSAPNLSNCCIARRTIHESSRPQCSSPSISMLKASQICLNELARTGLELADAK